MTYVLNTSPDRTTQSSSQGQLFHVQICGFTATSFADYEMTSNSNYVPGLDNINVGYFLDIRLNISL